MKLEELSVTRIRFGDAKEMASLAQSPPQEARHSPKDGYVNVSSTTVEI
jgi:hypothetical protein